MTDDSVRPGIPEEWDNIFGWLARDLDGGDVTVSRQTLFTAISIGMAIQQDFNEAFAQFYLVEDAPGERLVRHRVPRATDQKVDAVMNRIWGRRTHLLHSLYERHQKALLPTPHFPEQRARIDRQQLPGFFRQVAVTESRHVPREAHLTHTAAPGTIFDPPQDDRSRAGGENRQHHLPANWLAAFWGPANRFPPREQLEGFVSCCLTSQLAKYPALQARCHAYLDEKFNATYDQQFEVLQHRVSNALLRLHELERQLLDAAEGDRPALLDELRKAEARLEQMRRTLVCRTARALPRPRDVVEMLTGVVDPTRAAAVRNKRLKRERELFATRFGDAVRLIDSQPDLAADRALLGDVEAYLTREPLSPRQQGIGEAERCRRNDQMRAWRRDAAPLLERTSHRLAEVLGDVTLSRDVRRVLAGALDDAENVIEFAKLTRKGVLAAFGRRLGWRLYRLLRTEDNDWGCLP